MCYLQSHVDWTDVALSRQFFAHPHLMAGILYELAEALPQCHSVSYRRNFAMVQIGLVFKFRHGGYCHHTHA